MFFSKSRDLNRYVDGIFPIKNACKEDLNPNKINATIGSLYGEDNELVALNCVYDSFNKINDITKASYSSGSFGNDDFNEAILDFVLEGKVKHALNISTAGGTGAISLSMKLCLDEGESILVPEVAWGNYSLIGKELKLNTIVYDIYDIDALFKKIDQLERIFLIINSPCQNPCGLSYSFEQWQKIIDKLNNCGKEVIVLNDVAYMDYAYNKDCKKYFELLNNLKDNVLFLIAYSCSKAFSYYGIRLGSLIAINNNDDFLKLFINQAARNIRTTYSSVNNGAMHSLVDVINNRKQEYLEEKQKYIELLKERSSLFIEEAKNIGLEFYPYDEGFFVTLRFDNNNTRDEIFERLLNNHIYCIKTNKGIRVAICSIPVAKIKGLAAKIKALY